MVRNERDESRENPLPPRALTAVVPSLQIELGAAGGVTLI